MNGDKITYMANQIAAFYHSRSEAEGVAGIAEHINKFWEKRMRAALFSKIDDPEMNDGATKLDPWVIKAAPYVNRPT